MKILHRCPVTLHGLTYVRRKKHHELTRTQMKYGIWKLRQWTHMHNDRTSRCTHYTREGLINNTMHEYDNDWTITMHALNKGFFITKLTTKFVTKHDATQSISNIKYVTLWDLIILIMDLVLQSSSAILRERVDWSPVHGHTSTAPITHCCMGFKPHDLTDYKWQSQQHTNILSTFTNTASYTTPVSSQKWLTRCMQLLKHSLCMVLLKSNLLR